MIVCDSEIQRLYYLEVCLCVYLYVCMCVCVRACARMPVSVNVRVCESATRSKQAPTNQPKYPLRKQPLSHFLWRQRKGRVTQAARLICSINVERPLTSGAPRAARALVKGPRYEEHRLGGALTGATAHPHTTTVRRDTPVDQVKITFRTRKTKRSTSKSARAFILDFSL